jgi:excisionase family DNA binding protein
MESVFMYSSNAGERLIHVHHVARRLGVSERTVRSLAAQGYIPGFKVGAKLWRFLEREIDALVTRRTNGVHP